MEYRYLGRSGLRVSTITFGTMTFGGVGLMAKVGTEGIAGCRRIFDLCLDGGVTLFDTANSYGHAEEVLGEVMTGRRNRVILTSKCRAPVGEGPNDEGSSRHHIIAQCETSLKRLRTDHIDLYQVHGWDGRTPLEETLYALDNLVTSGKVRYIGTSNFSAWHLMKMIGVAEANRFVRPVAQEILYTLMSREIEMELVPVAVDQGVGILVWSPLGGGRLTGKYRRGKEPPKDSRGIVLGWDEWPVRDEALLDKTVELLIEIGAGHGVSAAQVALAWLLGKPGVTSLVIGARTEEQLIDNIAAANLTLTAEDAKSSTT